MVQPCCYCGVPLQKATQYVGIADVILGLINFILMLIHVKELFELNGKISETDADDHYSHSSYSSHDANRKRIRARTFPGLEFLPRELAIFILVCYGIQFMMGIVLYISATNKNRNVCLFWLGVTAVTALFTGLFIRLYEMLIVNEFAHELKQEEEVTYFPGQNPIQVQMQHYHHHHPQQIVNQQPMGNPLNPSADTHLSVITIPTVTPSAYNNYPNVANPGFTPSGTGCYQGQYSNSIPTVPYPNYQNAPAALQPPPYYEVTGNGGNSNGAGGNSSSGFHVESVLFPTEKNDYRNSFSKF